MALFGTAGIRGDVRETVTPALAVAVGAAAGRASDAEEFVLARDGRETGVALADALAAGVASTGVDVRRAGQLPTPALAFATRGRHGAMVTASHNPPGDNGIKLFEDGIEYDTAAERRVAALVEDDAMGRPAPAASWGHMEQVEVLPTYLDAVCAYARQYGADLDGLAVAVDCGNGMSALATLDVLGALGASVDALNANVDGRFPGRGSKPTTASITDLRRVVAGSSATLGIAHDGDADRIVVVDADGSVVHEDTVLAILAEHFVREAEVADPVVVTTPNASSRVDERVRAAGGRIERVALGALHEGVADARAAGGEVVFAGEPWKHVHPGFGGWIDGIASAAVLCRLVAVAGLDERREPVAERPYRKVAVPCPDAEKPSAMQRLRDQLPDRFPEATVDDDYGVRLDLPGGAWVLVRPSGTEPVLRIYAEGDDVDGLVGTVRRAVEDAVGSPG